MKEKIEMLIKSIKSKSKEELKIDVKKLLKEGKEKLEDNLIIILVIISLIMAGMNK